MTLNMLRFSASCSSSFLLLFHVFLYLSFNMILPLSADHFTLHVEGSPQLFYDLNIKISSDLENGEPSTVALLLIIYFMFLYMEKKQLLPQPHLSAICSILTKVSLLCKRLHGCGLENINNSP